MQYNLLGATGMKVSRISFGASSLSAVFHSVDESEAIKAVHAALDAGINYFDVAPAYGGFVSETILGRALKGIDRSKYFLSTKVGKYTDPNNYSNYVLDYSRKRIYQSLEDSSIRLGTDYFDIIYIHDIEYKNRSYTEWALTEGLDAVHELKKEGRIGSLGFGMYPIDLWQRIFSSYAIDTALVHNHYCLHDNSLLQLLPVAKQKDIGIVNASPFGSGLLTEKGPADWHPATKEERAVFLQAAELCKLHETSIAKLAIQYSSQHTEIPTTMFSSSNPLSVLKNIQWSEEPLDNELLLKVQLVLSPVRNRQWVY